MERPDVLAYVLRRLRSGDVRARGSNVEMVCPSCGGERKFAVRVDSGVYGCFRCGLAGTLRTLLVGVRQEWIRLARRGVPHPGLPGPRVVRHLAVEAPFYGIGGYLEPSIPPSEPLRCLRDKARAYAQNRGVTAEQQVTYRLGVRPLVPRLFFPYWNASGETTFWMGRAISDDIKPKTIEPGETADKPLFGDHVWTPSVGSPVFLTEGVFDHLATPRSFALMGSAINDRQLRRLQDLQPSWVCVLLDPDAGIKPYRVCQAVWRVARLPAAYVQWIGTEKDPGSLGAGLMSEVVDELCKLPKPTRIQRLAVRP